MANGDITLTVQVSGTLASGDTIESFSESKTNASIADIIQRTMTVPTSEVTAVAVGTVSGQTLASINGLVIYNTDATNFITVGLVDTSAKSVYLKVKAGRFLVYQDGVLECDDDAGGAFSAFNNIDTITIKADTAAVVTRVVAW